VKFFLFTGTFVGPSGAIAKKDVYASSVLGAAQRLYRFPSLGVCVGVVIKPQGKTLHVIASVVNSTVPYFTNFGGTTSKGSEVGADEIAVSAPTSPSVSTNPLGSA